MFGVTKERRFNMEKNSRSSLNGKVRKRYDRIAPLYDFIDKVSMPHWMRKKAVSLASGKVLEVGVGTGLNLSLYPGNCDVTAIDFSSEMIQKARLRIERMNIQVKLMQMDVQNLEFQDNSFDTVLATCVFCSVPDPILGLKEVRRACKKDGQIILLEHMRSENHVLGLMMDFLNPLFANTIGNNINRRTMDNIKKAGLHIKRVENLKGNIFKLIVATGD